MAFRAWLLMVGYLEELIGSVPSCVRLFLYLILTKGADEKAASNHQSVVMPVAQRGAENTCR